MLSTTEIFISSVLKIAKSIHPAKLAGTMRARALIKIGRSYYVSIPKKLVEEFNWYESLLDIEVGSDEIIIRKIPGVKVIRAGMMHLDKMKVNVGETDEPEE